MFELLDWVEMTDHTDAPKNGLTQTIEIKTALHCDIQIYVKTVEPSKNLGITEWMYIGFMIYASYKLYKLN